MNIYKQCTADIILHGERWMLSSENQEQGNCTTALDSAVKKGEIQGIQNGKQEK